MYAGAFQGHIALGLLGCGAGEPEEVAALRAKSQPGAIEAGSGRLGQGCALCLCWLAFSNACHTARTQEPCSTDLEDEVAWVPASTLAHCKHASMSFHQRLCGYSSLHCMLRTSCACKRLRSGPASAHLASQARRTSQAGATARPTKTTHLTRYLRPAGSYCIPYSSAARRLSCPRSELHLALAVWLACAVKPDAYLAHISYL